MWLVHCISCALLISALFFIPVSEASLASIQTDTATPSVDPYLNSPPREATARTPRPAADAQAPADCLANSLKSDSIYCRGSRAIRNVINNLKRSDKPLVLMRGLEIVPIARANNATPVESALESDDSFLGCVSEYLRSHELNIKFSDLLADESENYLTSDTEQNGVGGGQAGFVQEARKKDKGGNNNGHIMAISLMFGKMMAVMGLGAVGALAMKALGVAMAALLLAALLGLKSHMHHGHETSHSVQYVTADGHHHMRRRRSSFDPLGLAYRGWSSHKQKAEGI